MRGEVGCARVRGGSGADLWRLSWRSSAEKGAGA